MTLRIDRVAMERGLVLRVSGRMTGEDLEILRRALDEDRVVAIDLAEVALIDRDAVLLLSASESTGVELIRCPGFIREWITRERSSS